AGVHYCDLGIDGKSTKSALHMDSAAKGQGVTAVISTGWYAIMGLMAVYAAHQLSHTDAVDVCSMFDYSPGEFYSPDQSLARARERGYVETSWDGIEMAAEPVWTYRDGRWVRLESLENPNKVFHPSGSEVTAYLVDSPLTHTLSRHLPGVQTVANLFSLYPPALNELFIRESRRIGKGETDWAGAALDFFETAVGNKERYFAMPEGYPGGWWMWINASGTKDGQKVRYTCWPSMFVNWTSVPLIIIALRILRGDVSMHGVFTAEACMTLESFLAEVAKYVPAEHRGKPLLNERLDVLD
ncbi:MAG: hypothetical protein P1S60_19480, partial [Anaerolineae bacterium]|nr:hypothetical protein [Anaerolineae bacterium]